MSEFHLFIRLSNCFLYGVCVHIYIDGHLSYFPNILAIVNNSIALMYIFSSWILYHMLVLCFILEGSVILSFIVAASFFISSSNTQRFQFLHILTKTCYFLVLLYFVFNDSHLNGVKGYLVVLTCISLMISKVSTLSCAYWLPFFQKCLFKPSRPLLIFKLSYLPFCCWTVKIPYI